MSNSRDANAPTFHRSKLGVELLEDRTVPTYLQNPGASVAVGQLFGSLYGNFYVMGTGSGGGPIVNVYNTIGQKIESFFAYDSNMRTGVNVALADVNGDGLPEIITAPGPGGGANVKVFDNAGRQLASFFAYDPNFRGGVQLAAGDLYGTGRDVIVTGPGNGGGPVVRVFDGNGTPRANILTFDPRFRGGVNVAVGDVQGDGTPDIVTGAGAGGSPLVQVFTVQGKRISEFYAFDPNDRTGVDVASGNTDFMSPDEIWVTRGPGTDSVVRGYSLDGTLLSSFQPYPAAYNGGVNLTIGDATGDGIGDVVTVQATGDYNQVPSIFRGSIGLVPQGVPQTLSTGLYAVDANWTYYFPAGYSNTKRYSIMFAFDPNGDTANPLKGAFDGNLKQIADRYGIILVTSRYYRSPSVGPLPDGGGLEMSYDSQGNLSVGTGYYTLLNQIHAVLDLITNVNTTRVMLYGYGEGAGIAHALNFMDPTLADLIIADQGTIWGPPPGQAGPDWYDYANQFAAKIRAEQLAAGKRQTAIFMQNEAAPTQSTVMTERDGQNLYSVKLGYFYSTFITHTGPLDQPTDAQNAAVLFNGIYTNPLFSRWQAPP